MSKEENRINNERNQYDFEKAKKLGDIEVKRAMSEAEKSKSEAEKSESEFAMIKMTFCGALVIATFLAGDWMFRSSRYGTKFGLFAQMQDWLRYKKWNLVSCEESHPSETCVRQHYQ